MADIVELDMLDFDVILGIDSIHVCYASVDYRTRVVKFQFPNESVLEWKNRIDSFFTSKLVSKECVYHLV